jgi:uncharacterized membrane-anchored protein YjiN (DUF445 family)
MKRTIKNVRWANDSKTQIFCEFHYEDGRVAQAYVSNTEQGNPDWKEIIEHFGEKVLTDNTKIYLDEISQKRNHERQKQKEREEVMKNEIIFNAKLEAFSMDEIKNSKNTEMKSKIRKAKSLTEIYAYTSALLFMETMKKNEVVTNEEPVIEEIKDKAKRGRKKTT